MIKTQKQSHIESINNQHDLWGTLTKGFSEKNQTAVLFLGLLPALAVTSSFEGSLGMGLVMTLILLLVTLILSGIKTLLPKDMKIPVYLLVVATIVTMVKMILEAFLPELSAELGLYVTLITVNIIILGRIESTISKEKLIPALKSNSLFGLMYLSILVFIGFFRELVGTGVIQLGTLLPLGFQVSLFESFGLQDFALDVAIQPTGAYIIAGLLFALLFVVTQQKKEEQHK